MYRCFTRVLIFIMFISRLKQTKGLISRHVSDGAPLIRNSIDRGGHYHRVGSYHIICNSRRRLYIRPLFSSPTSSNNENNDHTADTLDSYLSQLRGTKSLTVDEVQSIKNALSNLDSSTNDDDKHTKIIKDSINIYISMNKNRISSSGQGIGNPGAYITSIIRNQLQKLEDIEKKSTKKNIDDYPTLEPILSSNNISIQELNDNCLMALSQCPNLSMADDALKAYTRQQKRREMNGTDKISNPSSYIMAVLRNIMAENSSTSSTSPTVKQTPQNDDNAVRVNKVVIKPAAVTTKKEKVKSSLATKPKASSSEVIQPIQQEITSQESSNLPQSNPIISSDTDNIHATKDKLTMNVERVTMEYVDKCISCLAKLDQPIIQLKGVGVKTEAAYHKLGIYTLRDLLWHFPRSFIDRSTLYKSIHDVPDGEVGTFILSVEEEKARSNGVTCIDESDNVVDVSFFYGRGQQGMIMVSKELQKFQGVDLIIVSGKVKHTGSKSAELFNPDLIKPLEQINDLGVEAVYALSSGLTQKKVLAAIDEALNIADELFNLLPESLSEKTREKLGWPKFVDALHIAHKPSSISDTGVESPARLRLAFEEMQTQQARLALERWKIKHYGLTPDIQNSSEVCDSWRDSPLVSSATSALPFTLSPSQQECLDELWEDIKSNGRMYRLLNGDVGTGKTVLSYLIGLSCIETCQGGGRVVSLLCPTQLLANQHVRTISDYAVRMREKSNFNIQVELLTGDVIGKQRDALFERLEAAKDNDAIFLVGTHALTTPDVVKRLSQLQDNKGLALAIIDEEQRFGVKQRDSMQRCAANILSMSATPMPRSISLQDSGIMDTTLLESDESRAVETTIVSLNNIAKVLSVLNQKVKAGSKCFWVVPRIEGIEDDGSIMNRFKSLVEILGGDKVCRVHGQMSPTEREQQLEKFTNLESGVLVGTTVIEVGIDVPNANILVVEEADIFGLSQLHQLRGRIGRQGGSSDLQCHCLLLSNATSTQKESSSLTRLQILTKSNKGSEIADADLILRGSGDMLGIRQSGIHSGYTVDQDAHWHLLKAATATGRSFMDDQSTNRREKESPDVDIIEQSTTPCYDQTSSSSKKGFSLRIMMTLFGDRSRDSSIDTIQNLDLAKRGELSQEDRTIHDSLIDFYDKRRDLQFVTPSQKKTPTTTDESFAQDEPMLPIKPHLAGFNPTKALTLENRLSLSEDDVMFIVLDVETTGLDDKTSHLIQLAGKVLGSDDENDLFSEYILPPIDCIPKKIEELTGITDQFLRQGGYDKALNKEVGTAREFRQVYLDFQDFCIERAQGRKIVFVAHNAKFDIRMINGELRRWRFSDDSKSSPVLGDLFASSLDTLHLFRTSKFWSKSLPRPTSFSLGTLHEHVLSGESMSNSHNAVGDVLALERLLQCEAFEGWQNLATRIQEPIPTIKGRSSIS